MRTLFVPLAVLAMAAPPAFSQVAQASAGVPHSQPAPSGAANTRVQEPAGPLTLRSAVAMAMRANPGLSSALREQEATEGAVVQAGAWPNPTLDVQLEDMRRDNRTTTLQLSQPIELGGKRSARVTAAERARDQAASALAGRRAEIRAATVTAFFDVLTAQERLRLAQDSVASRRPPPALPPTAWLPARSRRWRKPRRAWPRPASASS